MKAFQNLASPGMPSCSCEYPRVLRHLLMLWLITLPAMAEAFPQALWQKFARAQRAELLSIKRPAPDKDYVLRKRVILSPAQLRRSLAALKVGVGEFRGTRWTCFNPITRSASGWTGSTIWWTSASSAPGSRSAKSDPNKS